MPLTHVCPICHTLFTPRTPPGRYCSHHCRNIGLSQQQKAKSAAWPERTCEQCGKVWRCPPWYGQSRFCSSGCWYQHMRDHSTSDGTAQRRDLVCLACGQTFRGYRRDRRVFCSMDCYRAYNVGATHATWKHGRKRLPSGYIQITVAPNTRRYEHHVVMERMLGRHLAPNECVDHLNGIRDDNRPENLRVMTKSDHAKMHMAQFKKPPKPQQPRKSYPKHRLKTSPLGSRHVSCRGYIFVKTEHGWQLEHRLVAAAMMGRPLSPKEVVHHRDGNKSNNAPENLEVLPSQGHHNLITIPHRNSPVTKPRKKLVT